MAWSDNLANSTLKNLAASASTDGSVSFSEMLGLFSSMASGGVTASEYSDIKLIDANFQSEYANAYVKIISHNLIYENPANSKWWGGVGLRNT